MRGIYHIVSGAFLLILAIMLFLIDLLSLRSYLLIAFALFAVFTSFMTGKKFAAYHHDLKLASLKKYKLVPSMFIYLWLSIFVLMIIVYTLLKVTLGYFVNILIFPLSGKYMGIVYNLLLMLGAYLAYVGLYSRRDSFITMWGKMAERSAKMTKPVDSLVDKPMSAVGNMSKVMRKKK